LKSDNNIIAISTGIIEGEEFVKNVIKRLCQGLPLKKNMSKIFHNYDIKFIIIIYISYKYVFFDAIFD